MHSLITQDHIDSYARDGAVLVRGLFAGFVEQIAAGIEDEHGDPGPYGAENVKAGETGRFFDDYCNWTRIPPFREVIANSPAAEVAADLMESTAVKLFHDHVLVKEPGTSKPTPGIRTAPITSSRGGRPSASGARSIRSIPPACAVLPDRISGRNRCCRHAG